MSTPKTKVIREYSLPYGPEKLTIELTGEWKVLQVEGRFAKPHLYILEDETGPRSQTVFNVLPINQPIPAEFCTRGNVHIGCYPVPGNMLHVFGPNNALNDTNWRPTDQPQS